MNVKEKLISFQDIDIQMEESPAWRREFLSRYQKYFKPVRQKIGVIIVDYEKLNHLFELICRIKGIDSSELVKSSKRKYTDIKASYCIIARDIYSVQSPTVLGRMVNVDHATVDFYFRDVPRCPEKFRIYEDIKAEVEKHLN